jgi:O-antigen ligase
MPKFLIKMALYVPAILLAGLFFVYRPDVLDPALVPKFLGLTGIVGMGMIMLIFFGIRRNNLPLIWKDRLVVFSLGYIAVLGVGLSYTTNFTDGVFEVLKAAMGVLLLLYLLANYRAVGDMRKNLVPVFSALALVMGCIASYQMIGLLAAGELDHAGTYSITATIANRNLLSQVLLLLLPFSCWGMFTSRSYWKYSYIVSAVLSTVLIVALLARAVWVAYVVALVSTAVLYWWCNRGTKFRVSKTIVWILVGGIASVGLALGVYAKYGAVQVFEQQSVSIFDPGYGSQKDRVDLWTRSLQIAAEHPTGGTGPGTWKIEMLKYGTQGMKSADHVTFFQRPHNDFLWVLSENGIFGLLLYAAIFVSAMVRLYRFIRPQLPGRQRTIGYLLWFGLTAYLVIAMLSFPRERMEHQIILAILLAVIIRLTAKPSKGQLSRSIGIPGLVLAVGIAIFAGYAGFNRLHGEHQTAIGYQFRDMQHWNQVVRYMKDAESDYYQFDAVSTPLSWYIGSAWYQQDSIARAIPEFEHAVDLHPYHIHALNNLATCYAVSNRPTEAIPFYKRAVAIDPTFDEAHLNLAAMYFNQNQLDSAWISIANIDTADAPDNFSGYRKTIIHKITDDAIANTEESGVMWALKRILKDEKWLMANHFKAVHSGISFRQQIYFEAIYLVENDDHPVPEEEADRLRKKYIKRPFD